MATLPGVPDLTSSTAIVSYGEIDYVVWPWLVPGVRAEFTSADVEGQPSKAELLRIIPGVAIAFRPNVRAVLTGDFENGSGLPVAGNWGAAGGLVVPGGPTQTKFQAEQVNATVNVAF
jgi:hypothetical protein